MTQPHWTQILSAWSTFGTAIITVMLLVAAVWAGCTAVKTMEASQQASIAAMEANVQAKRDSIEQTRPYVFAELIPGLAGESTYDIRISNVGKSSARNLSLTFSNWPEKSDELIEEIRILFETSRTLPPSCSIRSMWRLEGNFSDGRKVVGAPTQGTIGVTYTSDDPSGPEYADEFQFDLKGMGMWPVSSGGPDPNGLEGQYKKFYKLGQTIARNIRDLSR